MPGSRGPSTCEPCSPLLVLAALSFTLPKQDPEPCSGRSIKSAASNASSARRQPAADLACRRRRTPRSCGPWATVSLEIINPEYSFEVLNTRLGDDPGDQCQVRVKEGTGQEYRGSCKPLESESDAPCEVELTADGSGFTGKVLCRKIPHQNNQSLFRYVVSPGTDDEPAEVVAQGCSGL